MYSCANLSLDLRCERFQLEEDDERKIEGAIERLPLVPSRKERRKSRVSPGMRVICWVEG